MIIGHHRQPTHASRLCQTARARRDERGYVLVMFAILFVPLLLMAGLSVDVGSWYNRASDIQKAADAAALAGVVWLPDVSTAASYARAAAERNGFKDGTDNITIAVDRVGDRRLKVTIKDDNVGSFFYKNLGGHSIDLTRTAQAEYVLPVPLGSPDNHFGNDPLDTGYTQPNLWGNIHSRNTGNTKGDAYASGCQGNDICTNITNGGYRAGGYTYTIDVAANTTGFDVQIYDAGFYNRNNESKETGDNLYSAAGAVATQWTLYKADNTPLSVDDNPVADSTLCTTGPGSWSLEKEQDPGIYLNKWASICKNSGTVPEGRYLLRVKTVGPGNIANRYALKVLSTSTKKPRIAGFGDFSMYNNITGNGGANTSATFYLAEVDDIHKGKTFRVDMYDPGEVSKAGTTPGDGTMQVLMPNGNVAANCVATSPSPNRPFANGATLPSCSFATAAGGASKFNGFWVHVAIPIPTSYNCTLGTLPGCWWKIRYNINGQANDTTTWSAQIIGDPVHLIDDA